MRTLCHDLSAVDARQRGGPRGLGAPAPRAVARHLPGRCATAAAWPRWCCRPAPPCRPRRRPSGSPGPRPPTRRHPAASRSPTPIVDAADRGRRLTPPAELWRPSLDVSLPTLLDHAPVAVAPPAPSARGGSSRPRRCAASGPPSTRWASPRWRPPRSSRRPPSPGPTSSRSTTSAARPTSRRARSSTSSSWSGVFERVYEVGPVFRAEPHDTVRHLAEYRSLDVELGFIEDHRDVMAMLREVLAGMVAAVGQRGAGRSRAPAPGCPSSPSEIPVIHFADALALRRRAGRRARPRARARARARRVGARRARLATCSSSTGYPMAKRPFYTHPQPGRPSAGPTASTCSSAGSSWSPAASGCTATPTTSAPSRARGEDPAPYDVLPRGVPPRDAAARRVRDRARALGRPAGRGDQHPRGHALPARPAPAGAVRAYSSTASGLVQMTVSLGV